MLKAVPMGQSVDVVLRRGYPMLYNPDGCPKQNLEVILPQTALLAHQRPRRFICSKNHSLFMFIIYKQQSVPECTMWTSCRMVCSGSVWFLQCNVFSALQPQTPSDSSSQSRGLTQLTFSRTLDANGSTAGQSRCSRHHQHRLSSGSSKELIKHLNWAKNMRMMLEGSVYVRIQSGQL